MSANMTKETSIARIVRIWLMVGLVMVFVQVLIGGITRLTDSGLSITEWNVIKGTLPPLNEVAWAEAFEKYKVAAKKQYESLHADMTLSEFKIIYFWEYFHRLWARTMGFVFLLPFIFFVIKGMLPRWLIGRLGITVFLAALAAVFGWIMVASGLNDDTRTWVSAYKLVGHLGIATALFAYLFWTWLKTGQNMPKDGLRADLRHLGWLITGFILLQIVLGGLMAGMRAGLIHPYFPFFVEGGRFWDVLTSGAVSVDDLVNYEPYAPVKGYVQILHRATAYLLSALIIYFFLKAKKGLISSSLNMGRYLLVSMLIIQFLLGVLTIINCFGRVPLVYGVMHQGGALILLAVALFINYQLKKTA